MSIEQQIYTSCPQGKGYEGISGFQVKARSPGLTNSMSRAILRYSNHYRVPRDLRQLENQYYRDGQNLPQEALARFPIALTYHHVEGDCYGLTCIEYRGRDYSGRPGNFYAHTLVFAPDELEPFAYNPLALAQSRVFEAKVDDSQTTLDSLPDLRRYARDSAPPGREWLSHINQTSYTSSYMATLSAIVRQAQLERPIILTFKEQMEAADYIEALLMLLPYDIRSRTTFTTYEPDPYVLVKRGGAARSDGPANLQIIATIGRESGGSFEFRPDEFHQSFLIWNFSENRSSAFPEASPYTRIVMRHCAENQLGRLQHIQNFIMQLGAGRLPQAWDAIVLADHLEDRLAEPDALQIVPAALNTLVDVARSEAEASRAIQVVWPLLRRVALGEGAPLLQPALAAYSRLLKRIPATSLERHDMRRHVLDLIGALLEAGDVAGCRRLATLDQDATAPLLSEAAAQLAARGWPTLSAQTPPADFARRLATLDMLTHEPGMREWVATVLWQRMKLLAELRQSADYFERAINALIPLLGPLEPESNIHCAITAEAPDLARSLLAAGLPARARSVLRLSRQDARATLLAIYHELVAGGWPETLPGRIDAGTDNQEALIAMLGLVCEQLLTEIAAEYTVLDQLIPAFRAAAAWRVADRLWMRFGHDLQRFLQPDAAAVRFAETIGKILEQYHCPDDLFGLVHWLTTVRPPVTLAQWQDRVETLAAAALQGSAPAARVDDLVRLIKALPPQQQVILLARILRVGADQPQISIAILQHYQRIMKAFPSASEVWRMRIALASEGHDTQVLLAHDFLTELSPWPDDGPTRLQTWYEQIFARDPRWATLIGDMLAQHLRQHRSSADTLHLCIAYLNMFQGAPAKHSHVLIAELLASLPIEIAAAIWQPWFDLTHIAAQAGANVGQRARVLSFVGEIESARRNGDLMPQMVLERLQRWSRFDLQKDSEAQDWATDRLLAMMGSVDLSSTDYVRRQVDRCLSIYKQDGLQEAIQYVCMWMTSNRLNQILLLVAFGRVGVNLIGEPVGEQLAEVVAGATDRLRPEVRETFWQLLGDQAARCEPPAVEALERFRALAQPAGLPRAALRFVRRLMGGRE